MKNTKAKYLLVVSLLLWTGALILVWFVDARPFAVREFPSFAHLSFYAASALFAILCCIPIARTIYNERERKRWFVLLPLTGLWGFPILFDVSLSAVVINRYLDTGTPQEHRVTLVRKNVSVGRWGSGSFIVTDWRIGGQTVSIGPIKGPLFDHVSVGSPLIILTRDGYLGAEWIVKIDAQSKVD